MINSFTSKSSVKTIFLIISGILFLIIVIKMISAILDVIIHEYAVPAAMVIGVLIGLLLGFCTAYKIITRKNNNSLYLNVDDEEV